RSNMPDFEGQAAFVFLWTFAGILAVTTATMPLGALGKYIEDQVSQKHEDLLMTNVTKQQFAYSYIIYAFIIGLIFTLFLLVFGYGFAYMKYDIKLPFSINLFSIIFLSVFVHTLFFYLITAYIKTLSAFSGLSTIVGTLIGFLAGIYIPIGVLTTYLQKVITLFPTTQSTVLLKNTLMTEVLQPMETVLSSTHFNTLMTTLGVKLKWETQVLPTEFSLYYLLGLTIILMILVVLKNRKVTL